jgi:hypothetical protein
VTFNVYCGTGASTCATSALSTAQSTVLGTCYRSSSSATERYTSRSVLPACKQARKPRRSYYRM